jgi:hypothetical protein
VLLERDRTERSVEEEEARVAVDAENARGNGSMNARKRERRGTVGEKRNQGRVDSPEEVSNIDVVRQRRRETDDTNE